MQKQLVWLHECLESITRLTSASNQLFKAQDEEHKRSEDAEMCT